MKLALTRQPNGAAVAVLVLLAVCAVACAARLASSRAPARFRWLSKELPASCLFSCCSAQPKLRGAAAEAALAARAGISIG